MIISHRTARRNMAVWYTAVVNFWYSGGASFPFILLSLNISRKQSSYFLTHIEGLAQDCSNSILVILQEKKTTDYLKYSQLFLIDIWTVWYFLN